jgi:hypothetical protein
MIKFEKMSSGDVIYGPKSAKLTSFENDRLLSPYDGEVVKTHNHQCEKGYMLIKHIIDKKVYYSQFCGIGQISLSLGDYVKVGKTIGHFSSDDITYSLLNSDLKAFNPKPAFSDEFKRETESKDKKEKESKNKETKVSSSNSNGGFGLVSLALKPIDLLGKQAIKQGGKFKDTLKDIGKDMFKLKDTEKDDRLRKAREDKENDEKNKELNENIERIKNLLK